MYKLYPLANGNDVMLIVDRPTENRLRTTCFRQGSQPRSGKFSKWRFLTDLFDDLEVDDELRDRLPQLIDQLIDSGEDQIKVRMTIQLEDKIGWSSTDDLSNYDSEELETFNPNKTSEALRIKTDRIDIKAPRTSELTLVFTLKRDAEDEADWVAIIHTIYPGSDIGPLEDNVSSRANVAFFAWDHPGA